jgi:hypothetical protein
VKIIAGGQTGVDRAAIHLGLPYGGWVPKGSWAEDFPSLQDSYRHIRCFARPPRRIRPSGRGSIVRDSNATLILTAGSGSVASPGTMLTQRIAAALGRPVLAIAADHPDAVLIRRWLHGLGRIAALNLAGPGESEAPRIYVRGRQLIESVLAEP